MRFEETLLLAISLALDAFAVAIGCSSNGSVPTKREGLKLAFYFGLFQFLMPIIGWLAGSKLESLIFNYDHWVASLLLFLIGIKMIYESFQLGKSATLNPTNNLALIALSVATSIDALAVGISLALLRVEIASVAMAIGIVTAFMSFLGVILGKKLGEKFGKRMELIGGISLILIGMKILYIHML